MVELDRHDVVVARYRPVGPVAAGRRSSGRGLAPSGAQKAARHRVLLVEARIADIDRIERLADPGRQGFLWSRPPPKENPVLGMLSVFSMTRYYRKDGAGDTGGMGGRPPKR